ncbi:hypothetical protein [Williamsia soli]|uniref:hypothetical protein n=1 Tax=Williamsia soli TaxID=364929 RepID=UPI001A9DDCF8|nr:hypothetical protein [Williamsia soli]
MAAPLLRAAALARTERHRYRDYVDAGIAATTFTTGANYSVGAKVIYNGPPYRCIAAVAGVPAVLAPRCWTPNTSRTGCSLLELLGADRIKNSQHRIVYFKSGWVLL